MRKTIIALALAAGLALTGCTTTETKGATHTDKSGTNAGPTPSVEPSDEPSAEDTPTDEESAAATATFGTAYEWEDGLYVHISKPTPFKPSEYAAGGKAPHNLAFVVKIVNNTHKVYDPTEFSTTLQAGNAEAEEVYDSGNGFSGSPETKLLPGREAQFKIGYNMANVSDLVLEVSPGFDYDSALFTSQ